MRILVVYYSFTSTVESLARSIETHLARGHQVTVTRIRPVRNRPYWQWLLLSFIPGCSVAITGPPPNLDGFDRICLGFPKWTLSCPPLNRYLAMLPILPPETSIGLFMGFGGFDEDRYLREVTARVSRRGRLVASLAVKRKLAGTPESLSLVRQFCDALVDARSPVTLKLTD
ncbi:MAG: hypothetical protein EHM18_03865 [Acidobacteria bacterium]|nr:MAG: hypothetical protein EHM18_03865 [Acidobacteriota bacterium]